MDTEFKDRAQHEVHITVQSVCYALESGDFKSRRVIGSNEGKMIQTSI